MVTRSHERTGFQFLPDGTVPLAQSSVTALTLTGGDSLLRLRTTLEIYVSIVSSTGNLVNFAAMTQARCLMGAILYDTASPPLASYLPITNSTSTPGSSGWLQYEEMTPTVDFYKTTDVEVANFTWRTDPITLDTQSRRRTTSGNGPTLWLAWEIDDQSGLINTTTDGTTYGLGAKYTMDAFIESFS